MQTMTSRLAVFGLALSVLAITPFGSVLAQDSTPAASTPDATKQHAPDPQKQANRLAKQLGLDSTQTAKILPILQARQQQMAAARADSSLAPSDRKAKIRSIRQDSESQLQGVLTPSQQQKYTQMQQNAMEHRQGNKQGQGKQAPAEASST